MQLENIKKILRFEEFEIDKKKETLLSYILKEIGSQRDIRSFPEETQRFVDGVLDKAMKDIERPLRDLDFVISFTKGEIEILLVNSTLEEKSDFSYALDRNLISKKGKSEIVEEARKWTGE